MAGYLDQYGAGDERRARNIKIVVLVAVGLAVLTGVLYFFFHNYRQEHQARRFLQLLVAGNYQQAYEMWAPTEEERRSYPLSAFMQDWAPPSVQIRSFDILDAESCENTVIVDVDLGQAGDKKLWVDRKTLELSFPPYDQCAHQNRIYNFYRDVKYRLRGRTYK
jgi:hypothetical protein